MPVIRSLHLPWLTVEYDRVRGSRDGFAVTKQGAVGVAFTGQTEAVWQLGAAPRTQRPYGPPSVFVVGACDLIWNRWTDTSEAIEIWFDDEWLARAVGLPFSWSRVEPRVALEDPVLVSVASKLREFLVAGEHDELRLEQLGVVAAARIARAYAGLPNPKRGPLRALDDRLMRKLDEYIAAHVAGPIQLHGLAREAAISPFHFAKRFKATTGVSPYEYVVARRMDRGMALLRSRSLTVAEAAAAVGYSQVGHFRRQFRAHWGQSPGRLIDGGDGHEE
jgi:AraC family transcriptional regulator